MIPGFDRDGGPDDTAEVPPHGAPPEDRTQALPRSPGSAGTDDTQILPPGKTA